MDILLLLLRLGLAGVMALAGVAKLADLNGSRKAFEGFGVPASLSTVGPVLLSVAEIVLAGLLLFPGTSWLGAVGTLGLLLLFVGQMTYQLAKGNAPDCHCFGQVYSAPVSAVSVIRNVLFAIPAGVLVVRGRAGQGVAITDPAVNVLELGLGLVIIALLVAAIAILRKILVRQNEILKHIEVMEMVARDGATVEREEAANPNDGLPIGAIVPQFEGKDILGEQVSLADLRSAGVPVLLIFVSPNCTPCKSLIPEFKEWISSLEGKVRFAFFSTGTAAENIDKFGEDISTLMILQDNRDVAKLLRANWTPTAILMDSRGRVASHTTAGDGAIRSLVEAVMAEDLTRPGVHFTNGNGVSRAPLGAPVPEISVSDIQGREITSDDFRGKQTLVTFWSSTCPHCVSMLDELRTWDKAKGQDEPNLIVFSDGDPEYHLAMDMVSPVILDPGHKTAEGFGMFGTPSAVLIDEKGIFISETAIGAADIWALIGRNK